MSRSKSLTAKVNGKKPSARDLAEAAQHAMQAEAEAIQTACWAEIEPILKKFGCVLVGVPQFGQIQGSNAFAVGAEVAVRHVMQDEDNQE